MASSKPVLTYFPVEAAAEKVRLAFVLCGVDFTDERIPFPQWAERKASTPYGQLPVLSLSLNGETVQISQSGAMCRYVLAKYDTSKTLYPVQDPDKFIYVEEMIGLVEDFQKAWQPSLYIGMNHKAYGYPEDWPKEEKNAKIKELRERFIAESLPKFMGYFSNQLKKVNGGQENVGFLCGSSVTLADLYLVPQLRYYQKGIADNVPTTVLDDYPTIVSYINRFLEIPEVKKWYNL